jgi:hypothetical protein
MKPTLKQVLQGKTKTARTLSGVIDNIFKDMYVTAASGGTYVIWRGDEEYAPGITFVAVVNALNTALKDSGLVVEVKNNQEEINARLARNAQHRSPAIRAMPPRKLRQWLVISWEF